MKKIIGALLCIVVLFVSSACQPRYIFIPPVYDVDSSNDSNEEIRSEDVVLPQVEKVMKAYPNVFNKFKPNEGEVDDIDSSSGSQKGIIYDEKFLSKVDGSVSDLYLDFGTVTSSSPSVTLLGNAYKEKGTTDISIGNNVFYRAEVFKIEGNKILLNKVALIFSALSGSPVIVEGRSYTYNLSDTVKKIAVTKVTSGSQEIPSTNNGYTIEFANTTTLVSYEYDGKADGDIHFIVTKGEDGKVTSTAIDATYATDFGFYLYPYGADPATLDPRDVVKESYVISSGGTFKGCVELTFHISIDTTP